MITITGATGRLGGLIIEQLLKTVPPKQIVAISRSPEKTIGLSDRGVIVRQGDYDHPKALTSAFAGSDVLMFIGNTDFERREEQHNNVVDAAKQADVGRVVYISGIQTNHNDPVALSHVKTEQYIKASGLPYTFLRDNFYMDMYLAELETSMEKGVYRTPCPADSGAAFVGRADVARAAAAALSSEEYLGRALDMTGPAAVTPTVFAEAAANICGKPVVHQPISWDELAGEYRERGIPEAQVPLLVMLERIVASNAMAAVNDNIEKMTGQAAEGFESYMRKALKSGDRYIL